MMATESERGFSCKSRFPSSASSRTSNLVHGKSHQARLRAKFRQELVGKRIVCLHIADIYEWMRRLSGSWRPLSPHTSTIMNRERPHQCLPVSLSGKLHAQCLDLERPHREAHLLPVDARRAGLALQQIGLDRAGDRARETQAGRAALVVGLVQHRRATAADAHAIAELERMNRQPRSEIKR